MIHGAIFMLECFIDQCQCAKKHSSDHVWGTNMPINVTSFTSVVHVLHLLQCVVIYHDIDLRYYGFSKTFSFTVPLRWKGQWVLLYTLQTLFPNITFLPKRLIRARGCAVVDGLWSSWRQLLWGENAQTFGKFSAERSRSWKLWGFCRIYGAVNQRWRMRENESDEGDGVK